jgi:hypothetical protein
LVQGLLVETAADSAALLQGGLAPATQTLIFFRIADRQLSLDYTVKVRWQCFSYQPLRGSFEQVGLPAVLVCAVLL